MIVARSVVGIHLRVLLEKKLHTRFDATDELSQIEIDLPSSPLVVFTVVSPTWSQLPEPSLKTLN